MKIFIIILWFLPVSDTIIKNKSLTVGVEKETPTYFNDLKVEDYRSEIDTSFNYMGDIFDVFPELNDIKRNK